MGRAIILLLVLLLSTGCVSDPASPVGQLLGRPGEIWGAESNADQLVVIHTGIP